MRTKIAASASDIYYALTDPNQMDRWISSAADIEPSRAGRLHILEVQRLIRFMPKVVICVVPE